MDLVRPAIERAKQGDTSALHFLYVRYADEVFACVHGIVHDAHDAEDITQTMFAKLMGAIHRYEERDVPFAAWILRVARNAALDHLRARRQIPSADVRPIDEQDQRADYERMQALGTALERLPLGQREVLILRHIAGLSPGEIAAALGKSESAVHGLHHRGRKAMREALLDLDSGPVTIGA